MYNNGKPSRPRATHFWARQPNGDKLHAFPLPLADGAVSACKRLRIAIREHISSPAHNEQKKCGLCLSAMRRLWPEAALAYAAADAAITGAFEKSVPLDETEKP